ncbi:hypothetical protein SAMN04489725_1464 [Alicyclobacillus hesperidum]|uniref:Uncharacterized protein n=1 Tax=Alicyclobacillus hesperidum TaxID=89784 RepID=A0A1H2YNL2_9BACL|nr:hypothetical protein [Alicyclobacillus hesperidum]SDX06224.1 hypothetical protein SAMN04489725_1464 [Alicyclobacillus hesperidum]
MKSAKIFAVMIVSSMLMTGCGASNGLQPDSTSQSNGMSMSNINMPGMNMTSSSDAYLLSKAFVDEYSGFDRIQADISKGDYNDALNIANSLHDEFHVAILPPLRDKKGDTFAEAVHSKYDALQDAIQSHDKSKILILLTINRSNLKMVAKILGVKYT